MTNEIDTRLVLTFDGQDDYIDFGKNDIGGILAEGSSTFTISGWIHPHELKNRATTYGVHNVFFARSSDRYSDNFEFGINESGNLDVYIDEKLDNKLKTFGNGELTVGQWHFFAIAFDHGQITIYLDNHTYTDHFRGPALNKATSHVTLGATLHNYIFFTGQLANISIWNYPCSPTEIQAQQHQVLVGNEPGLVAYWTLNEAQGTIIQDVTGHGHNGKLYGDPNRDVVKLPLTISQSSQTQSQPQVTKKTRKKSSNTQISVNTPINTPVKDEEIRVDQTNEKEDLVILPSQEILQTSTQVELAENTHPTPNSQYTKYKILAIDGGGIRSIISARVLAEIEKRTQKQIASLFDLIVGTSTGGIIALGLTKPKQNLESSGGEQIAEYSAEEFVKLFVEYGFEIFYEPFFEKIISPLEDIFTQPKYSTKSKEEILQKYFGDSLLENNLKEVFVPSYDIERRIPIFFTNKLEKQQTDSRQFRKLCAGLTLTDVALATSATPTYFPPHRISRLNDINGYNLIDGGLVANNPANLAILEAQINAREKTQILNTEDILLVSLGTGSLTNAYSYKEAKNWGLLQWGKPLLDMVFDGGSELVAGELARLFKSYNQENQNYYRFQPILTGKLQEIDNIKLDNIRQLQVTANRLIAEKSQQIDDLCTILLS